MRKLFLLASVSTLLPLAYADSLGVTESTNRTGAFYNYTYTITGGTTPYTDVLLTSADLSPLNVQLSFDNGGAGAWTWYDASATQLDFFNSGTGSIGPGDTLVIKFASDRGPGPQTIQGYNINTHATSAFTSTQGPVPVPEPGSATLLVAGGLGLVFVVKGLGMRRSARYVRLS